MPLTTTEFGTIRIGHSRATLDSVVHHYMLGASADQIVESFPSLKLGDICTVIPYYLANRESVEEYLNRQEAEADAPAARERVRPNTAEGNTSTTRAHSCSLGNSAVNERLRD